MLTFLLTLATTLLVDTLATLSTLGWTAFSWLLVVAICNLFALAVFGNFRYRLNTLRCLELNILFDSLVAINANTLAHVATFTTLGDLLFFFLTLFLLLLVS